MRADGLRAYGHFIALGAAPALRKRKEQRGGRS
jgi:hypothetical protein